MQVRKIETKEDIDFLKENKIRENKIVEYKLKFPEKFNDAEKKELLADITSFANTQGGNIIYGVKEKEGVIVDIEGIGKLDIDGLKQKIESLVKDGLDPRLNFEFIELKYSEDVTLVVLYIPKSFNSPHRVKISGRGQFYQRSSAGKFPLDTDEIRRNFMSSMEIADKIRNFREKRIQEINFGNIPFVLESGPKIIVHYIPISFESPEYYFDIGKLFPKGENLLPPIYASGISTRITLDGHVSFSANLNNFYDTYTQVCRNTVVESVNFNLLRNGGSKPDFIIPCTILEKNLMKHMGYVIDFYLKQSIQPPVYFFMSFHDVKGYSLLRPNTKVNLSRKEALSINDLYIPEIVINDFEEKPDVILKPIFDMIWNSFGYERCFNYDEGGNRIPD